MKAIGGMMLKQRGPKARMALGLPRFSSRPSIFGSSRISGKAIANTGFDKKNVVLA
jgi:hypothetical protein